MTAGAALGVTWALIVCHLAMVFLGQLMVFVHREELYQQHWDAHQAFIRHMDEVAEFLGARLVPGGAIFEIGEEDEEPEEEVVH